MRRLRVQLAALVVASMALPATPALAGQTSECTDASVQLTPEEQRLGEARTPGDPAALRLRLGGRELHPGSVRCGVLPSGAAGGGAARAASVAARSGAGPGTRSGGRGPEPRRRPSPVLGAAGHDGGTAAVAAGIRALRCPTHGAARPVGGQLAWSRRDRLPRREGQGSEADAGHRLRPVHAGQGHPDQQSVRGDRAGAGRHGGAHQGGPVRIETAMFPVRWADFARGTVEQTLRPHLPKVDLFTTISQGRPGRFDIERNNGAWRGTFPDNDNISPPGPSRWPTPPHSLSGPPRRFPTRTSCPPPRAASR